MSSTVITFSKLTGGNRVGAVDIWGFKLPFPRNLEIATEYMWEAEELGVIGSAIKRGNFDLNKLGNLDAAKDMGMRFLTSAGSAAAAAAAGAIGGTQAGQGALSSAGAAINPKEEVLFKGVKHRRFDLTFDLAPLTAADATATMAFLRLIHMLAAPELQGGGAFYKYPETLSVVINGGGSTVINRGNCAVTAINANLSPEQIWAVNRSGTPVHLVVQISFIELDLPTREKEVNLFNG